MTKIHYRPYNPNQTVLFPQRIDEDIAENDPVRMVNAMGESLNLESFRKLYRRCVVIHDAPPYAEYCLSISYKMHIF